ncbi:CHAT domain-containing protein [Aquimarina algiphila]|uniref:CHAT domain-containing protein n=1 Tax=Aquimarina algiphila TaxID=2047982 RepID=UPI00248FF41B|nr:CHAT domain-containing tetratricopeptide repeat protein [Aquimarina algiphila]
MKIILKMVWGAMLIFTHITIHAQVKEDTLQAHQYFVKGDSLFDSGKYRKSIPYFKKAASEFKDKLIWSRYAYTLNKISQTYYQVSDFENSIININEVLKICKEKLPQESKQEAKAYSNKAKLYRRKGRYNEALDLYTKALSIIKKVSGNNHIETASLYNNMGIVYDNMELIDQAQLHYEKSLKISQLLYNQKKRNELNAVYLNLAVLNSRIGLYNKALPFYNKTIILDKETYGENHPYVAEGYYNLGSNYSYTGEDNLALQYFLKGLSIIEEIYKQEEEIFALFYNGIGSQYSRLGKLDLAHIYYVKALHIYEKIYGINDFTTANILSNMAYGVFFLKKEYDKALEYLEKSYRIRVKLFGEEHRNTYVLNEDFGEVYEKKEEYDIAETYFKKLQNITIKKLGQKNQNTASSLIHLGRINLKTKEYTTAIEQYHKALISCSNKFKANSVYNNPVIKDYTNLNIALSALHGKAKAFKLLPQGDDLKNLEFSLKSFISCDSIIDFTRNSYVSNDDKILLQAKSSEIYKDAIDTSLLLYEQTKEQEYRSIAFYFSEKSKARLLNQQLKKVKAEHFTKIPQDKLTVIEENNTKISLYKSKLYDNKTNKDSLKFSKYSSIIFSLTQKNDSIHKFLEKEYPKYYKLKYNNELISIAQVQEKIQENTSIIEYFVAGDIVYVFVVSKNNFSVKEININNLNEKILQFHTAIKSKDNSAYRKIGYHLYQQLIEPLDFIEDHENLIIIPDGILWQLNFDLLLTEDINSKNPKHLSYLLKKQVISYANSIHLFFSNQYANSPVLKECLAFSFSNFNDLPPPNPELNLVTRGVDDDLPGTREEIKEISKIINGSYFYDKNSIETNFKNHADQYALLHLALHGELDHENPENSKLYFTKTNDSLQDNYLYNHELYAMDIPAELVVLSACNTGSGKISKGEGIMSLGRAFQYAGTKSLVLTNWEVSDETTPELMKNFYTNLKEGMSKSKALQQAKLQYLNSVDVYHSAPFYWGAFYLIGDASAIEFQINNRYYLIFISIGIILVILLFFLQKRIRKFTR